MWKYLITYLFVLAAVDGARILAIFPSVWKSHYLFGRSILSEMASRHKITLLSPFREHPQENITDIRLTGIEENWLDMGLSFNCNQIRDESILERFTKLIYATTSNVDIVLRNDQVQKILQSDQKFDLLILDLFLSDALLGLANYYKIPAIVISSIGSNKWSNEMLGNPHNSAVDPNSFLPILESMSLGDKIVNTLMSMFEDITYNFLHLPYQEAVYLRHFTKLKRNSEEELPPLSDLVHNVSLVLLNSHPLIQYPRAYVPNMVEVAGAHIKTNITNLSQVFTHFIEEAPDGVILFSMGANLRATDLPQEKLEAFLGAFKALGTKMRIIMKWEKLVMENQPPNVVIGQWIPQAEILAHPNVKIFISTVGIMSAMEAMNSATVVLGLPIYPEQDLNLKRLERQGSAMRLNYDNLTKENILSGINKLLKNSTYQENAQRVSKLFTDNLVPPLNKSIYSIEYVLRTNGAAHLRSAAINLGFFRTKLIDVSLIIFLGVLIIIAVPSLIICYILKRNNSSKLDAIENSTNPKENIKKKEQ